MISNRIKDNILGWQDSSEPIQRLLLQAFCDGVNLRSIVTNTAIIVLLSVFFSSAIPMIDFLLWCAGIAAFGTLHRIMAARVSRQIEAIQSPRSEALRFVLLGALYGLFWGAGGAYLFWQGEPLDQGIILFVMTFSAVIGPYAPIPGFSRVRFFTTAIPFVLSFLWYGEVAGFLVTGLLAIWLFLRFSYMQRYQKLLASQYQLQTELAARGEELQHANDTKDGFLASMSHELRTPLNGILGMARMLQRDDVSDDDTKRAQLIEKSGQTLLNLLNGILESVRVPLEDQKTLSIRFSLSEVLEEVTDILAARAVELDGVDIELKIDETTPDFLIGDVAKLRHIIYNLLSNAVDFADGKPIEVRAQKITTSTSEIQVRFSVKDQGMGVTTEDQSKIFQRFTQLENQPTERVGTGLGLAIAKDLVANLGGALELNSVLNEGSEFFFTLNFSISDQTQLVSSAPHMPVPSAEPLSILLVEDLEINQIVAQQFLENSGHRVTLVANGKNAIERASTHTFDAILLDIQLPDMDGTDVAKSIRKLPNGASAQLPIIALTANALKGDDIRYTSAGIDFVLTKPLDPDEMAQCLSTLVKKNAHADDLLSLPDLEKIRNNVSLSTLNKMIQVLEQEWRLLFHDLKGAQEQQAFDQIASISHKITSMSASLALDKVREFSLDMEAAALRKDKRQVAELIDAAPNLIARSIAQLAKKI